MHPRRHCVEQRERERDAACGLSQLTKIAMHKDTAWNGPRLSIKQSRWHSSLKSQSCHRDPTILLQVTWGTVQQSSRA